jgi:hypothetical protein
LEIKDILKLVTLYKTPMKRVTLILFVITLSAIEVLAQTKTPSDTARTKNTKRMKVNNQKFVWKKDTSTSMRYNDPPIPPKSLPAVPPR